MTIWQALGALSLAITAFVTLALNFSIANTPTNYRISVYVLFFTQFVCAAFLAFDRLDAQVGLGLIVTALAYETGVTIYNRTGNWAIRRALFLNPRYWITTAIGLLSIMVMLGIAYFQKHEAVSKAGRMGYETLLSNQTKGERMSFSRADGVRVDSTDVFK